MRALFFVFLYLSSASPVFAEAQNCGTRLFCQCEYQSEGKFNLELNSINVQNGEEKWLSTIGQFRDDNLMHTPDERTANARKKCQDFTLTEPRCRL